MKKTVKTTKKALSLFLSVVMMLTTLTVAIPGVANAAEISPETVAYNSGISVQFLNEAGNATVDSVDVNHTYISTNDNVNTVHTFQATGFDTVRIRLRNMNKNYPITVLSVVADKAYIGASASASASAYNTETVIAANGYKDLYIVSPADFNEGGNITYTITYRVDGGYITNICGGNTFTTNAYLYVNPADQIRHGLHEGINIEEHPGHVSAQHLLSFWYYLEADEGYITNEKLNSADKFLDDMTVTADDTLNYDGRANYRTFDFAEACHRESLVNPDNDKSYSNGQCLGDARFYSDGHIVTYNYYYDVNKVDSWDDALFRARLQENYLSSWTVGVNLKYLRLAADQNYLDGIKGSNKKFTVTFNPFPSGTGTLEYSSSGLAQVDDIKVDTSVLIDGKQNKWGSPYEDTYINFSGALPTDTSKTGKIMFSPKLNMQTVGNYSTAIEDSSFMTTHINLIPYDKAQLRKAVTEAEQAGYCSGFYFDTTKGKAGTTYEAYETALANAKAALGKGATTQADIDAALEELNTAVAGLKALEHNWGAVTYTWAQLDGKWICSATRHCPNETGHDEYAIAEVESNTVPGTCVDESVTTYTATFEEDWATNPPEKVVEGSVDSEAHNWKSEIEYKWSDDMTTCTATKVCLNDASHNLTETVTVKKDVENSTCADKGKTTYTADFKSDWAEDQTKTEELPLADHNWVKIEYTWNDDNTECTATRTCDKGHTETVKTTNITSIVVTDPTCADEGTKTYTATFETDSWASTQTKEEKIPVSDHIWEKIEYTWNADNTECTVTRTCTKGHTESETVKATVATTPAECEKPGETKYTADFTVDWAVDQEKTVEIPATEHNWGEPTYTWNADNTECTATIVCQNDPDHIKKETVTAVVTTTAGTCKEEATTTYTATFADGTEKTVTVEGELGEHDWADELVYTWSEDNKTCTATKVCKTDASHNVEETVTAVVTTTAGTCKEEATTTYTATFADGTVKTVTVEGELGEHDWADELVYTWSEDNKTCTAIKVCKTDASHNVEETVTAVVTTTAGTCKEEATTTYTATFADGTVKTVTVEGELGEHNWVRVDYVWSVDNKTCTAIRVCGNDSSHYMYETVNTTVAVTPATCEKEGEAVYTADFKSDWAEDRTTKETLEATDHNWGEPTYTWSADNTECTATRVCKNDPTHTQTETVKADVATVPSDCGDEGKTTYTADFEAGWAETQEKVETIPTTEHNWVKIEYTWSEDNTECTATRTCDKGHTETETVKATVATTPAECEKPGETKYIADFEADWAETQTKKEEIPALEHKWTVTYEWSEDKTECTATRTCENGHSETATAIVTSKVTKEPTCQEEGEITYTAEFAEDWAEAQTEKDEITALEHKWTVTYEWSDDNTTCTATAVCENGHTETETVKANVEKVEPNCVDKGETTYTAEFTKDWAETQVKEIPGDTYGDHSWDDGELIRPTQNEDGTWNDGEITYTCEHDEAHTRTEPAKRADYTEYDAAVEKLKELLKDEALKDSAREKIEKALADNAVPDNLIVPEQDQIKAPTVNLNAAYDRISGDKNSYTYHSVVFGKTNGIGWYKVSEDGGKNFKTVFGNNVYEVKKGTELWISVGDIMGNSFTFYVNGDAVKPDENGILKIKVNGYMLIGALGFEVETPEDPGAPDVPDVEESLNWFQKIIKAIKDFFAWIGSWFK